MTTAVVSPKRGVFPKGCLPISLPVEVAPCPLAPVVECEVVRLLGLFALLLSYEELDHFLVAPPHHH